MKYTATPGGQACITISYLPATGPGITGKVPCLTLKNTDTLATVGPIQGQDIGDGDYAFKFIAPITEAEYIGQVIFYETIAKAVETPGAPRTSVCFVVEESLATQIWCLAKKGHTKPGTFGEAVAAAAAEAGLDSISDQIPHDGFNNSTGRRIRVFDNPASVDAATIGAADDTQGECFTFYASEVRYVDGVVPPGPRQLDYVKNKRK